MKARYWPCFGVKFGASCPIDAARGSRSSSCMNVRYRVELDDAERAELKALVAGGKGRARKLKRAQILLAADGGQSDEAIAACVGAGTATVYRTKRRFVEGNLERALAEEGRPGAKLKLSQKEEALLVATACSAPPSGRARWTLSLLAGAMVALTDHEELSRETVRRRLGENKLKPWRQEMWCIPEINGEYVARMEHVLDLYAEAPNPQRPLVCFDESPTQLIGEVRSPIPAEPGQLGRYDSEYQRNGTANLFIFFDAHRRWRHVKVTDRRTSLDFAECMRDLVDVHYPSADLVRVVLDNLSTHTLGALYEAFEPEEARRILRRLELHFVPKHGSWLNMVEIEIGVLRGQCLERRIEDVALLNAEVAAWEHQRNHAKASIEWMFTTEKAREKMGRAYPKGTPHPNDTLSLPESSALSAAAESSAASPAVESSAPSAVCAAPSAGRVAHPTSPSAATSTGKRPRKNASRRLRSGLSSRFKARSSIPQRWPGRKTTGVKAPRRITGARERDRET
jgi:transposase